VVASSSWTDPKDLEAARDAFLPFSTRLVELVQCARAEQDAFRSLKVFYCSMAPKPGLWFQAKGPLRNPFYGAEMLTCGKEIRPVAPSVAVVLHAEPAAPKPEAEPDTHTTHAQEAGHKPPVQPASPPNIVRTLNNRHPEAKERMARAFGLGVAARHQAGAELAAGIPPTNSIVRTP
jgi:hypothetical protein